MKYGKKKTAGRKLFGMGMVVAVLFLVPGLSMGAVLQATPDHVEFGTVDEGDPVVAVSEIVNTGSTPVEITNVQTSWACTEAVLGKHTLQPNEKTELKVTYSTEGRPGPFEKRVTLTTNIPGQEKIEIFTMNGVVREAPSAKISVKPRRVLLDEAERSTGKKQAFSITNSGSLPLEITKIRFRDGSTVFFDGSSGSNLVVDPGRTKTIELQLPPDNGTEPSQKYILIECNARNAGESGYFLIVQYGKR